MAEETEPNEKKENSKGMPNILIVALVSFVITVVVTGLILFFAMGKIESAAKSGKSQQPAPTVKKEEAMGPTIPLGNEILVNIAGIDGNDHYLKVNITLEADNDKTKEEVTKRIPQIRDMIITILSSVTKEKIVEKEGKETIRSEIIKGINRYMVEGKVKNVYFEDFVVQ